jgi:aryl sulfotransferase
VTRVRYQSFLTDSARWDGFAFRPGDIIISTPAKCGTTWTQMICALLIFQTPELPASLDLLSPWMEMRLRRRREVWDLYEAQAHRRFIKSHTPLDGLPVDQRITYICVGRDPRDVALSWNAHMGNLDFDAMFAALGAAIEPDDYFTAPKVPPDFSDERDAVRYWVDDPAPPEEVAMSLAGMLRHLAGFWEVRDRDDVVLLHYDDLQADLEGEMRRLAGRLGIEVPGERWPMLVKAATFDDMRRRAEERAPDTTNRLWKSTIDFFHRGTSGQWEGVFDAELAAHYEDRVRELALPDFVAWLHPRGMGGVPPTEAA